MVPGARSQFGAPMFEPGVFRKQTYCVEKRTCDNVGTFWRLPQWFGAGEIVPSLSPSLRRSTPDLHELDRQSQLSWGGCHICELQDQPLIFADDLVLLASSQHDLQHALDQFSAACNQARMKISTKNTKVLFSLQTKGSVCCKWAEYTAAGGEIQVYSGGINEWQKEERWGWWMDC